MMIKLKENKNKLLLKNEFFVKTYKEAVLTTRVRASGDRANHPEARAVGRQARHDKVELLKGDNLFKLKEAKIDTKQNI